MRIPRTSPSLHELVVASQPNTQTIPGHGPTVEGRYIHWDKLTRLKPPAGLTHEAWWLSIKLHRLSSSRRAPLLSVGREPFRYILVDPIPELLHRMDKGGGGTILLTEQVTNEQEKDYYLISSLTEEAITSSQLEGALTTRVIAKEMLRTGRPPVDRSERMILNNFRTMQRIGEIKSLPLTPELVFDLHRELSQQTLDDPTAVGRFRREDERIIVGDQSGEVYHVPPPASELPERMQAMCDFANGVTPPEFVHPVLRAIILHFWLAYDHPFVDGNGRTARALFYWSMLRNGYWLFEYVSISSVLRRSAGAYYQAFLETETDENDLTYFILHQLGVMEKAVNQLHDYIQRKTEEMRELETQLRGTATLNYRQRDVIAHALKHPGTKFTFSGHRTSHKIAYQTARVDLLELQNRSLLTSYKVGKTWYFRAVEDLRDRLHHP
jgi:Fic family protein